MITLADTHDVIMGCRVINTTSIRPLLTNGYAGVSICCAIVFMSRLAGLGGTASGR